MMDYKILLYGALPREGRAGILIGGDIYDAERLTGNANFRSTLAILEDWPNAAPAIDAAATQPSSASRVHHVDAVQLLAPILFPGAYFCAAANYRDHSLAMAKSFGRPPEPDPRTQGIKPFHFVKSAKQATIGPREDFEAPHHGDQLDWEIELAAVIGRPCKRVPVTAALEYVAGYTVSNDLSIRDRAFMRRPNVSENSPFNTDFIGIKGFDKSVILGPWITPAAQIGDPADLGMKLWIGEELMQNSNTSQMMFSVAEQIAYLSERITLLPGDVVLTGTPAGTGMEQGRFLKKGETIRMWIENIGETRNTVL